MALISSDLNFLYKVLKDPRIADVIIEYINNSRKKVVEISKKDFFKVQLTDEVYALEQSLVAVNIEQTVFESHQKYVDIQFMLEGFEHFGLENCQNLRVKESYNPERDIIFYATPSTFSEIKLSEGWFSIFFPQDSHLCKLMKNNDSNSFVKTVVKVPVAFFN